ncbi:MAG TPA: serine hydrolase domain-containing protein [Anaerolineales bacterium]|nr:serine hydrolase domain-containing protein [Anaerolineales bacterium]
MNLRQTFHALFAFLLFLSVAVSGVVPASAQAAGEGPSDPAEVEAFMDGLMTSQMREHHIPGAVVVVVKDGEVLFSKGYGYADLEARIPVDPQRTLFRSGSVSKLFVWTSVMQLVEQGKLSLEADVNEYLDFEIPATYPQSITLKTLMTHTPGFEDRSEDLFKLIPESVIPLEVYLKKNLPARVFPPGRVGAYSNYGTALAGYIVERISGMPFYVYVEKNIFFPLDMTQATFRQPLPEELAADMASGYNYVNGGYVKGEFEYVVPYPAGSLSASGLEMAKFMIAHLQNGRYGDARILKEETARQMHSQLGAADPRITGMAYGFFEDVINDQYVISHGGDTLLFHTGLFLLPERNVGFFVSTNAVGGATVGEAVARAFADRYFHVERAADPIPTADFDSRMAQYIGEYHFSRSNFTGFEKILMLLTPISVTVDENKNVILSVAGQASQYVEVEPGLLINREYPDLMIVMKEENGQVSLHPSSPFVFIKTPWYGSMGLHFLIFLGGALLFLITLIRWVGSFFSGLWKREPRPLLASLARLTGGLFALVYLAFLIMFMAVMLDTNPAYGVPNAFFEAPAWFGSLISLPILIGILGVLMLPFAIIAWVKRFWTFGARLSYTFLTLTALAVIWALSYWNFLL